MKYKLIKLDAISGQFASVYSVAFENEEKTLFDKFIDEYGFLFKSETIDLLKRIKTIAHKTGARAHFFKEREGKPGDGVCALYDEPGSNLRLYCIRYGTQLVIIGGGGHKPKTMRAFQEDKTLTESNYFLRKLSAQITERIKEKEIYFSYDYRNFEGELEFEI
jgi:putative component of toxin-antitoxin plasmid stabilization module